MLKPWLKEENRLCQGRRAASVTAQTSSWAPHLSIGLGSTSGLGQTAQVSRPHHNNVIEARNCAYVSIFKAGATDGTDSPWEDCIEEANEWKRSKYQELVKHCQRGGWKARCGPIEVGCRGFAGRSLCKVLTLLGITGAENKKAIKTNMEAAERASRWLWIRRRDLWTNATGTQAGV